MSTIKNTFFLKEPNPNGNKKTLILLTCYFKKEEKKFVYSTGEKINPIHWDKENKKPRYTGKGEKDPNRQSIRVQLNRYTDKFEELQARCKKYKEDFTSQLLREYFNDEFKKNPSSKAIFFKAYDEFMQSNIKKQLWSPNTVKRYNSIKKMLLEFQEAKKQKLTFNKINKKFHENFTEFCMETKGHATNTYRRNLGNFKTFMFWSLENGYTYLDEFKKFKPLDEVFTEKIALKEEDLRQLMDFDFEDKKLERVRDVFVFACSTGMRFGELKLVGKQNVRDGNILLKEEKGANKKPREIPLNPLAEMILRKYNFALPLITNQKHNEYIKDVFKDAGFDYDSEKIIVKGKTQIRETVPFYQRISTHTARRTFITMMKRKKISDKLIASITGHTDLKTLNSYYQVDDESKKDAVKDVFGSIAQPLRKVH
ncbi:site-specific integrase [Zobellia sp.]|nr:site-specific integrase [Zobellia sp.]